MKSYVRYCTLSVHLYWLSMFIHSTGNKTLFTLLFYICSLRIQQNPVSFNWRTANCCIFSLALLGTFVALALNTESLFAFCFAFNNGESMAKKEIMSNVNIPVSQRKNPAYSAGLAASHSSLRNVRERTEATAARMARVPDLVCLSHLRWDFVWQRPQHLMSRCARDRRVFFVEEPIYDADVPRLEISPREYGVQLVVPHLPNGLDELEVIALQQSLLQDELFMDLDISNYLLWYYTPMALSFTRHLEPLVRVYDCMDELSAFKNAPQNLKRLEAELLECADLVFTGGHSLYEAKRHLHQHIHPFPSSIEAEHFQQARQLATEPADQREIPHPRLGFFGVIDERLDIDLLAGLADARPDWHLVVIGPVVKIDLADLPQRPNIHYLGGKNYKELPAYLAGWDIAMLPFARNESTRFISPTKTPEYLAAGIPVISTSIRDVVRPYGQQGLVKIADTVPEFIQAAESLMCAEFDRTTWLRQVDETLATNSWDRTWGNMLQLIKQRIVAHYPVQRAAMSVSRPSRSNTAYSSVAGD
jgi:glycosyltransferase involved in cell wall biosynthesis